MSRSTISKVLVANRGEIAIRVFRAARDAGLRSVAVYAEPDIDAPFVSHADEALALGGQTPADSYLNIEKILAAAARSGADTIHPGYGFLSENADFAQAVLDAGLIWIGPSPQSIRDLGDKVTARAIAQRAQAPMAAGTKDPVGSADDVIEFARQHGVPVAIKAAYGGGGRGMKVAHTIEEIPEKYESATREAIAAFGRGECFVEQYLDQARHVEAQVLADMHGNVVVVGTRDCSLQRRFQKLVEEAPAPFLTDDQRRRIHESAKAICREADYHGAGTVEYMVQGDTVSFLEVNTRLQVEHPVTEETAGIDLVREQFRIACGEKLDITEDPAPRGHAFEFRINCEDPGRGFLPAPGPVTGYREPSGPGVRVDSGVTQGTVISGQFDSLLAKLIVTGATRTQALERSRRALAEFEISGLATVLPFHRLIASDPAFTRPVTVDGRDQLGVYTKWIENEWVNPLPAHPTHAAPGGQPEPRQTIAVEVDGRRIEVTLPGTLPVGGGDTGRPATRPTRSRRSSTNATGAGDDAVTAPMQGTVIKVAVTEGQQVAAGDLIAVLEAMKMENPVVAHRAGTVTDLAVEPGQSVTQGTPLARLT